MAVLAVKGSLRRAWRALDCSGLLWSLLWEGENSLIDLDNSATGSGVKE